jgi:allophanate hydrolase
MDRGAVIPAAPVMALPGGWVPIVVVGAHLTGMPLNKELTGPGGVLLAETKTAADYKLYALPGTVPPKPGMVQVPGFDGPGVAVEVWALPEAAFGAFVARIPAPLGIGKVELADGSRVSGFLCEAHALEGAEEVTRFGGWRAYRAQV